MGNLKFEIGDFVKDMYRDDFLDFCAREIDKLKAVLSDSYLKSNKDSIERILYDEFTEASFCIRNNLRFLRKEDKYSSNKLQTGTHDLCVILDVDGLDVTLLYNEGNIESIEYQTSNGNIYSLAPLLEGYLEQFNLDKNINLKVLARLTVPYSYVEKTDSYKTVKEIVCEKLDKGDFKDLELHGIFVLDDVKENCLETLAYKTESDTGLKYEEVLDLGGVEIDENRAELNEFLHDVEIGYTEDSYEYIVQGLIIVDCKRGIIHRENTSEIDKYKVKVDKIDYVQRYDKIVPRCTLGKSINKLDYIEFNSVAEVLKSEFVEGTEHTIVSTELYGLVPLEPKTKSYWGILRNF